MHDDTLPFHAETRADGARMLHNDGLRSLSIHSPVSGAAAMAFSMRSHQRAIERLGRPAREDRSPRRTQALALYVEQAGADDVAGAAR